MALDPESVPQQSFASLQSCLVEGDPEQRLRERRVRRKALVTSVFLQAGILAVVILVPLFAKPARLITGFTTPLPPYRPVSGRTHATQPPRGNVRRICVTCFNSHPANLAASNRVEPRNLDQPIQEPGPGGIPSVPCPSCIDIPTAGPTAPAPETPREKRLHVTHIDPAMLIHRVEPVYPRFGNSSWSVRQSRTSRDNRDGRHNSIAASDQRRSVLLSIRAGCGAPVALQADGAQWRGRGDRHFYQRNLQHGSGTMTLGIDGYDGLGKAVHRAALCPCFDAALLPAPCNRHSVTLQRPVRSGTRFRSTLANCFGSVCCCCSVH